MAVETNPSQGVQSVAVGAQEGEARWWLGSLAIIKVTSADTGGLMSIIEMTEAPGAEGQWLRAVGARFLEHGDVAAREVLLPVAVRIPRARQELAVPAEPQHDDTLGALRALGAHRGEDLLDDRRELGDRDPAADVLHLGLGLRDVLPELRLEQAEDVPPLPLVRLDLV